MADGGARAVAERNEEPGHFLDRWPFFWTRAVTEGHYACLPRAASLGKTSWPNLLTDKEEMAGFFV